jgi:putative spermidine/putrescine transport system ATP-binding protein
MQTSLELKGLSRRYGEHVHALRSTSLVVEPGEFLTLLGPSGSGKSTILRLLAGLDRPSGGDILINGHSVLNQPSHRRDIGMVFQNYALFPRLSVEENIAFPLRVRNCPEADLRDRVRSALKMTRLERFRSRMPAELSGGQQQRVALARAIVFGPRILLMDEPLGALDRRLREDMKLEIKRIQQELGITVLFVTHDQDEALTLSDRIAVMQDGALEQVDTPVRLYTRPRNRFVAALPYRPAGFQGRDCWVMLRPEKIDLTLDPVPGALPGRILEVTFMGEITRYLLQAGGVVVTVRRQNRMPAQLHPDQPVYVSWDPADAVLLQD